MSNRQDDAIEWPDESLTPACNLLGSTRRHWQEHEAAYQALVRSLRKPRIEKVRLSVDACSVQTYRDVEGGARKIVWCPSGMDLFESLYPFFVRRGLDFMMPPKVGRLLADLSSTQQGVWIVSAKRLYRQDEYAIEEERQGGSGMFARFPSVTHWTYLVALALSMQKAGLTPIDCFPQISVGLGDLIFVRTSTWLMDGVIVGMAYMPGKALFFDAFSVDAPPHNLVTADAFLL